jgi:hypothetical protein
MSKRSLNNLLIKFLICNLWFRNLDHKLKKINKKLINYNPKKRQLTQYITKIKNLIICCIKNLVKAKNINRESRLFKIKFSILLMNLKNKKLSIKKKIKKYLS